MWCVSSGGYRYFLLLGIPVIFLTQDQQVASTRLTLVIPNLFQYYFVHVGTKVADDEGYTVQELYCSRTILFKNSQHIQVSVSITLKLLVSTTLNVRYR